MNEAIVRFARTLFGPGMVELVERMRARWGAHLPDIMEVSPRNFQERLWAGPFGDEYTDRNLGGLENNRALFAKILALIDYPIWSVIELGAGAGSNLQAIKQIDPEIETTGLEINPKARALLERVADHAIPGSLLGFEPARLWDLAFTKGVLIHVAPEYIASAYETLYRCSSRYILMAEYYNPTPQVIQYRGYTRALWRRDFASELMGQYPNVELLDYGFVYHRDRFPQDDVTWFLMEKHP